jgi:pimeloyl-ACP methyl ester carboxylesterase
MDFISIDFFLFINWLLLFLDVKKIIMKQIVLFFVVFFSWMSLVGQTYQVGHTTINFIDASRNNRSIPTEVYYPADSAGNNVALTAQNSTQFPVLVFGHGFLMSWDAYQNFWDALVPQGYIMVFPKTETTVNVSHLEFAKDISFLIDQINSLGTTSSSLFYNRVSPMNAVMGHSMGGGASFLSVPLNAAITTIVNFAPAETSPSAIQITPSITIPTLIFAGSLDCVTPPQTNQIPLYNGVSSDCKTYISITGGNHCQMGNTNILCSTGELFCSPPTISRSTQHTIIFSYLLPWLNFQLKQDCNQGLLFDSQIASDSAITYLKNCVQCTVLSTVENDENIEVVVFPNPTKEVVSFKAKKDTTYELVIFDVLSKVLFTTDFNEEMTLNCSNYLTGTYFYQLTDSSGKVVRGTFMKM